jgi:N-acetylmuramoyl-L-alanine amidase
MHYHLISKFIVFLISFTVVLDSGDGEREKNIAREIAVKLKESLVEESIEVVYITPKLNNNLQQFEKASIVNQTKGDVFVSLHLNSCTSNEAAGFEIFYNPQNIVSNKSLLNWESVHNQYIKSTKILANAILFNLDKEFNEVLNDEQNMANRGITEANVLTLIGIAMPSIMIEMGFITNDMEYNKIKTTEWQKKFVNSLSKSILEFKIKH